MTQPIINDDFATITLAADPLGNYVTWSKGKKQVRALLKANGWTPVGTFRIRKEGRNEFKIQARHPKGGLNWVTCVRQPGATLMCERIED